MSSLVAPKPKRLQSPKTIWQESDLEQKFSEDPSLEVKRILLEVEEIPIKRKTPKRKDREPSPPIRSQNPFEAEVETEEEEEETWEANHEVGLIFTGTASYPLFNDPGSPKNWRDCDEEGEFHDPRVDNDVTDQEDRYEYEEADENEEYSHRVGRGAMPEEDNTDMYIALPHLTPHALPFQGADMYEIGTHLVLQIATAPVTPCYKRKRGENISRSLPDIRFPDYLRHSHHQHQHQHHQEYQPEQPNEPPQKRSSSCSPPTFKAISLPLHPPHPPPGVSVGGPGFSLLTSALLARGGRGHRRCRTSQLTLTGLIENVNELDGSGVISPTQRYRHTVS